MCVCVCINVCVFGGGVSVYAESENEKEEKATDNITLEMNECEDNRCKKFEPREVNVLSKHKVHFYSDDVC